MESAFSTKVSQFFTKGLHYRNKILFLIIQNLYHQHPLLRHISLNLIGFKNPKTKTQIVYLDRQFYPENSSTFHKMYLDICKIRRLLYSWNWYKG